MADIRIIKVALTDDDSGAESDPHSCEGPLHLLDQQQRPMRAMGANRLAHPFTE